MGSSSLNLVVMLAYGNDPKPLDNQLGYGERQGADSATPEIQSRIVTQWQLDKAPGVVPAQLIFSGVHADRTALVRAADVPLGPATTMGCPANENVFQDAFSNWSAGQQPTLGIYGGVAASDAVGDAHHEIPLRWRFALVLRGQLVLKL
jgi:hypothetical protein